MARHFKNEGSYPSEPTVVRAPRGGDESYHAPAGNRYSAPGAGAVGYDSVVGGAQAKKGRPKRRAAHTDPYDIRGGRDPKRRRNRIISTVFLVIGLALLIGAAGMWIYNQQQYRAQDEINEKLASYATVDDTGASAPQVDWASLKAVNPDVVGWVQIPGTVVNYPVYQGSDNDEYLRTNAEGQYSVGGRIFLDADNTAPGMVDRQSIIYGHHLYNGTMFKAVADLENQGMFDSVQTIWYVTETATYELRPLFTYKTDGDDENVRTFSFESADAFHTYLSGLAAKASSKSSDCDALISAASNVLSLCTCSYTGNETGRVILVCVPK